MLILIKQGVSLLFSSNINNQIKSTHYEALKNKTDFATTTASAFGILSWG